MTALIAISALAYPQIVEALPSAIAWILWILPPIRFFYEPLQEASISGLPTGLMASFSLAVGYVAIATAVTLKLFMRNERF